jgi:biotin carboxyl carrier protein
MDALNTNKRTARRILKVERNECHESNGHKGLGGGSRPRRGGCRCREAPGGIAIASKFNEGGQPPRVEVVRPRRITMAQRLQTNATLEAFKQTDPFAKVSGYLSDVRVDIGDHVKAGQVLSVIDVPEMKQ